jgi:hypothetical protein
MVRSRGEWILRQLGIAADPYPGPLAWAIAPVAPSPFRQRLQNGLTTLLSAIATRRPPLATAAACRLVGVGPGATPLGDDYLAAGTLTVAVLGSDAGFRAAPRERWLEAALPRRLEELTTEKSRLLLENSVQGRVPSPVRTVLDIAESGDLADSLRRLERVGATSGRAWACVTGAAALLLGAGTIERKQRGGPTQ